MSAMTRPAPSRERWSYVIHILLSEGRVMEIEGIREATEDEINAFANKVAKEHDGVVQRLHLRTPHSAEVDRKDHVRHTAVAAPLALPPPEPPAPILAFLRKTATMEWPTVLDFVCTKTGEGI